LKVSQTLFTMNFSVFSSDCALYSVGKCANQCPIHKENISWFSSKERSSESYQRDVILCPSWSLGNSGVFWQHLLYSIESTDGNTELAALPSLLFMSLLLHVGFFISFHFISFHWTTRVFFLAKLKNMKFMFLWS
jgi:hypothetical protein